MRAIFLGAPGAGKGTQAGRLAARFGIPHLSTGDMLRAAVTAGSEVGRGVAIMIERGELVPDDVASSIVLQRTSCPDAKHGFVLDGFPRTIAQAMHLDRMLTCMELKLNLVIELAVDEAALLGRILKRASDARERGQPIRSDDNAQALKVRLVAYHTRTTPLVEYYSRKGILRKIDGLASIGSVSEQIAAELEATDFRS